MADPLEALRIQFHQDMVNAIQTSIRELHYNPTLVSQRIGEYGSVETAHWIMQLTGETSGFTKLWEARRLDLSVEAIVVRPEYAPLFTLEERRQAYDTLVEYHCTFPPGVLRP
jgi:hypothetical protein